MVPVPLIRVSQRAVVSVVYVAAMFMAILDGSASPANLADAR